jgi:hypothetical protein
MLAAALVLVPRAALADLQYDTAGEDVYRLAPAGTVSRVSYTGTERLSVVRQGKELRFTARARYSREGPDGKSAGDAVFVQVLHPDGTLEDRVDDDPDFLTVLNQPFAVRLDPPTLRDLRALRGRIPFDAMSPLGNDTVMHGFLRPGTNGEIGGRQTMAVRFEAAGAISGSLPGYSDGTVSGTMRMDGTAYYSLDDATLLALRVTLELDARMARGRPPVTLPLHVTYRRSIRATSKTPPPAPLATGDGTAARATP